MFTKIAFLAALAATAAAVPTEDIADAACSGAIIIAARGSIVNATQCGSTDYLANLDEITGPVQQQSKKKVTVQPVVYPASTGDPCTPPYIQSRKIGEDDMKAKIMQRVDRCGDKSNIVLLGYSQGAQVITDLLSGGSSTNETALGAKYVKQLSAVVIIANPAQKPGAPYNNDKPAPNGAQPAPDGPATPVQPSFVIPHPKRVASLGNKVVAYCQKVDFFCDAPNANGKPIHQMEVETWAQPAIDFILKLI